ncbi:MAG TPA: NFACT family protein [Blastocatellia bacterium]|nr:NFACT family protein [Blastocatellia bacterium]
MNFFLFTFMEAFTLHALVTELSALIVGQRLHRIVQLGTTDVALDFRRRDERWLWISTDPQHLAVHLTARPVRQLETRTDTPFVALAKKYLSGAQVTAVEGLGYDRVVRISFVAEAESGEETPRDLVIQLTGRSANLLLVEQDRVLAGLRERQSDEPYQDPPPPADKLDPFDCPPEKLEDILARCENDAVVAARLHLIGFGPQFAEEFAARTKHQAPSQALSALLDEIFAQPPRPVVYSSAPLATLQQNLGAENFTVTYAPIAMEHLAHLHATPFASVNEAADTCHTLLDERRHFLAARQQAVTQLNTRLKKLQSLHQNLTREQASFVKAEHYKRWGELLLANLHQAENVENTFRVVDFYDPEQKVIAIPAAQQATAQEAAEHYFKLARKARNGLQTITARLPEIQSQISALKSQLEELQRLTEVAPLNAKLAQLGLARSQIKPETSNAAPKKTKPEKISGVRRYRSSDGYEILVGRTSRDNDHLTMRIAKSFDLWFHAADYGGSHVVLRNPKRGPVPPRAIHEAARLAAKFSQANSTSGAKVAVNYCEKKFVTKPKGFAPGQVRLSSFKTVMVEPAEAGKRIY